MISIKYGDIGIYKITNTINEKVYIGQSRNLGKRIAGHKNLLFKDRHDNAHLQRAYNLYGKDGFKYEVIELCELDDMNLRESYWIAEFESGDRNKGYNIDLPLADTKTYIMAQETKDKIRDMRTLYTDEELISYLHEFYYMEGRVPTQRDFVNKKHGEYPSYTSYFKRYGSFQNAIIEADLYDFSNNKHLFMRKLVSREDIVENFSTFIGKHSRFPSAHEQRNTTHSELYNTSTVLKHFNNIQELKDVFGYTKEKEIEQENAEALISLKKLYDGQGYVERKSIDKSPITRSTKFYSNRFGSLYTAYELAGINPKKDLGRSKNQINKRAV